MRLVKKPRQVFFEEKLKGKHTGYIFVSRTKQKTKDPNKIQINFTSIYYKDSYYEIDSTKCINFIDCLMTEDNFTQYLTNKYNIEFTLIKIYSIPKSIEIYIVLVDFNIKIDGFKSRIFLDLYKLPTNDIYESVLNSKSTLNMNAHIKTKLNNEKEYDNVKININLAKIYKSLIGI
tara:strand:- start:11112 stop:11639 length:528 start_codon:yes stop_codon:yes gene_type:complete